MAKCRSVKVGNGRFGTDLSEKCNRGRASHMPVRESARAIARPSARQCARGDAPGNNLPGAAGFNRAFTTNAAFPESFSGNSMRSIFPSAAVTSRKYALVSSLRAQGFGVGSFETAQPGANDLFLVADGEGITAPARTS